MNYSVFVCSLFVRLIVFSFVIVASNANAQMQIGSLSAGGGLHYESGIANSILDPISLSHQVDPTGRGTYSIVSTFGVSALFTYAGPDGRKDTVWVRPGGQVERFKNKAIEKRKPDVLIEEWTAVSTGAQGAYTFHGHDCSVLVCKLGLLDVNFVIFVRVKFLFCLK